MYLYYMLIKLSAINISVYLILSTKCFNKGRLIWNSNTLPKTISDMLKRNIQDQHYIENVTSTCNWHDFDLQKQIFLYCAKRRDVYHFS